MSGETDMKCWPHVVRLNECPDCGFIQDANGVWHDKRGMTLAEQFLNDRYRRPAPPQDGDEIETAFETVTAGLLRDRLRRASGPSWITPPHRELDAPFAALATIHRTMEGLRAENARLLKQMNDVADDKGKAEAERDELAYRVSFLENMYLERRTDHAEAREATSRAEQAEAALDKLRDERST
jgi:hypothetical protein